MDIDLKDSNLNKGIEIRLNKNSVKKKQKPIKVPLTDDQRKKRKITILLLSITFIILLGIGFLIYKGYIFSKELGFRLDTNSLTSSQKTELKKDSSVVIKWKNPKGDNLKFCLYRSKSLISSPAELEVAEKICHRIGIINKGKIIAVGTIDELRQSQDSSLESIFLSLTEEGSVANA